MPMALPSSNIGSARLDFTPEIASLSVPAASRLRHIFNDPEYQGYAPSSPATGTQRDRNNPWLLSWRI